MPFDPRTRKLLSQIAAERSCSLSEARRFLIEQIDLAKRRKVRDSRVLKENSHRQISDENRFRKYVEPVSEISKPDLVPEPETAKMEPVKTHPAPRIGIKPFVEKPSEPKLPTPGSQASIILGVLRDTRTFADAENALYGMLMFRGMSRSALRMRMYRVCKRFNVPIR